MNRAPPRLLLNPSSRTGYSIAGHESYIDLILLLNSTYDGATRGTGWKEWYYKRNFQMSEKLYIAAAGEFNHCGYDSVCLLAN